MACMTAQLWESPAQLKVGLGQKKDNSAFKIHCYTAPRPAFIHDSRTDNPTQTDRQRSGQQTDNSLWKIDESAKPTKNASVAVFIL